MATYTRTAGEIAYEAYGVSTGHLNFQGGEMPAWKDLPEAIRKAWEAAAEAVIEAFG
jgi:hypothetical protein